MGDGTTSVVIVAAELLRRANELVRAKIHPTSIIAGYRLAMREVGAALLTAAGCCCLLTAAGCCCLLTAVKCCCSADRCWVLLPAGLPVSNPHALVGVSCTGIAPRPVCLPVFHACHQSRPAGTFSNCT